MQRERKQLIKAVSRLMDSDDEEFKDAFYDSCLLDTFSEMLSWLQERRDIKSKYDVDEETDSGDDEV